ncbi:MAG TPA: type VI secretion system baseplate subunit TssE [Geoalkalibacter subterraneus]|uniref:Type VI secretion system baseplate subunit TssE n=1 Tax=Geoalkalibacter subterraneus TaxID=483547 RepID=A0A831PH25_9BACT|nr:type VI secretion system baseplate subunit TssE [Geoalkalibacter subterraneus]
MALALFDILTGSGFSQDGSGTRAALDSVQTHLQRLFNTRRGSLVHLPDYGLPDIGAVYENLPYSVDDLARQVRLLIERYEPRLSAVRVRRLGPVGDDRRIHLEVAAALASVGDVRFRTVFESAGNAQVNARGVGSRHA